MAADPSRSEKSALASFLRARRAAVTPEAVGVTTGARRRVSGLRREEVARLAGISVEYYRRLEQGSGHQMSLQVCRSLAKALRLDPAGVAYLQRLALSESEAPYEIHRDREPPPALVEMITQWEHTAAYIIDRNQDILVVNDLMRAVAPGYVEVGNNLALMQFEAAPDLRELPSWQEGASTTVARVRYYANHADARWKQIVAWLLDDHDFRRLWEQHEARPLTSGTAPNYFPAYGWVDLRWQILEAHPGLYTVICYGIPGSVGERALMELRAALGDGALPAPTSGESTPTSGSRLAQHRGSGPSRTPGDRNSVA